MHRPARYTETMARHIHCLLMSLVIAIPILGATPAGQEAAPAARISGHVIDQSTASPIPNARVLLVSSQRPPGGVPLQTMTDAAGS